MTGVSAARGFRSGAVASGIKEGLDLVAVVADRAVPAAAVFTTSAAAAAPVQLSRSRIADGEARTVLLNSGCANAATPDGVEAAMATSAKWADALGIATHQVLVCSTGPIGPRLPVGRMIAAMPALLETLDRSPETDLAAATGIMTTDTVPKQAVRRGGGFTVGGMAKGAGMIRPDMATMLAVITTDAVVEAEILDRALRDAVAASFNRIDVDGCMSTNDAVIALASGSAGVRPDPDEFSKALTAVARDLAWQIVRDGEGTTKVVRISVSGADSAAMAERAARAVAGSLLVRAALWGGDVNVGRVVAALGSVGIGPPVDVGFEVAGDGLAMGGISDHDADVEIGIVVGDGAGVYELWTTDITPEYVRFNGEIST